MSLDTQPRCLVALVLVLAGAFPQPCLASESDALKTPKVVIAGLPFDIGVESSGQEFSDYRLNITKNAEPVLSLSGTSSGTHDGLVLPDAGQYTISLISGGQTYETRVRALPGILTVLPPAFAILMALIFRQVVVALFAGVWLGAFFIGDYRPVRSFFYVVDHYVVGSLSGSGGMDHARIGIFTLLLGGMVGIFSRIGGTQGVVNEISRIATTPRRGQLATWLMGIAVFFDDYTNTLIVGNMMRPITDKLKISREKLSYIVDSTAAPVACIAVITSWIGFEISLVRDAFSAVGMDKNPFTTFVASLQYSFYPLVTLFFGLMIAGTTRDFGPMLKAERRSRTLGKVLADGAFPISNIDRDINFETSSTPRWFNAAIPIGVVVVGTFAGLVITGRSALNEAGVEGYSLMDAVRQSNSFVALLWSSLSGCVAAILLGLGQRLASLSDIMNAWVAGVKSMMPAIIILVLAWCIGSVCTDLQTADYLVSKVSGILSPRILPTLIFLVAAAISFSTGTSWGTMTILTPITIPLVVRIAELNALAPGFQEVILLSSISAILAGSVFGDHCSPISDTTIMSSMASAADHVDHVRTQLPYAATAAIIAIIVGYLPSGFALPSIASLALCAVVSYAVIRFLGKPESSYLKTNTIVQKE